MRHGEAVAGSDTDPNRPLTQFGCEALSRLGEDLLTALAEVKEVWSSPWLRTQQTAAMLEPHTGAVGVRAVDELLPCAEPAALLQQLEFSSADTLLLVGHQPLVGRTAAYLCEGPLAHPWAFAPADLAVIDLDWPAAGLGSLRRWHHFPG
ncbi:phosphohistidine phosphatase SixA [Marinobacterium lutimaris]|uniref:phosphohistidine phosphatase SixA n=1 Tax=Marinobacterium lutimaris TaxID=568106 RepID=UPI0038996826